MCDRCRVLEQEMGRCDRLRAMIGDHITVDRITELLADLKAEKAALHPVNEEDL